MQCAGWPSYFEWLNTLGPKWAIMGITILIMKVKYPLTVIAIPAGNKWLVNLFHCLFFMCLIDFICFISTFSNSDSSYQPWKYFEIFFTVSHTHYHFLIISQNFNYETYCVTCQLFIHDETFPSPPPWPNFFFDKMFMSPDSNRCMAKLVKQLSLSEDSLWNLQQ